MYKLVLVSVCALLLLSQTSEAFKIININVQGHTGSAGSAAAAEGTSATTNTTTSSAPLLTPQALLEGVQSVVNAKVGLINSLVNTVVQLKSNIKQGLLRSFTNTLNNANSIQTTIRKPYSNAYFTKTVHIGYAGGVATGKPATTKPSGYTYQK